MHISANRYERKLAALKSRAEQLNENVVATVEAEQLLLEELGQARLAAMNAAAAVQRQESADTDRDEAEAVAPAEKDDDFGENEPYDPEGS